MVSAQGAGGPDRLLIVMPVLDDWTSLRMLVRDIEVEMADVGLPIEIIVVDDCSMEPAPDVIETGGVVQSIELVRLAMNVGHQRAIAVGVVHASRREDVTLLAVMDSDGEDRPAELRRLVQSARANPAHVYVAQRSRRSESLMFRSFYWLYRQTFQCLTGKSIAFGNFSLMPFAFVRRIATEPNIWNHFAASMVRSRLPLRHVPTVRGVRYAGQSKMNFVSLVVHGLGAISVFSENVFVRILISSCAILTAAVLAGVGVLCIRFFTDAAIPGWATSVLGFAFLAAFQAVMTPVMIAFLLLSNRAVVQPSPRDHALSIVEHIRLLTRPRACIETSEKADALL